MRVKDGLIPFHKQEKQELGTIFSGDTAQTENPGLAASWALRMSRVPAKGLDQSDLRLQLPFAAFSASAPLSLLL